MANISMIKRLYYSYLGSLFAFTFRSQYKQILWFSAASWLKFLSLLFFFAAFGFSWGLPILIFAFVLMVWIWASYWWAGRQGYVRFVPNTNTDLSAVDLAGEGIAPLADGAHVKLYASGTYALVDREEKVLLRPSEYWRSATGDHGVMVSHFNNKFLYQFFQADTLDTVQPGWLIFGKEPLSTVAITFWQTWGPDNAEDVSTYMIGGGETENKQRKKQTIYFTFEDTAVEKQVMAKLLPDLTLSA